MPKQYMLLSEVRRGSEVHEGGELLAKNFPTSQRAFLKGAILVKLL